MPTKPISARIMRRTTPPHPAPTPQTTVALAPASSPVGRGEPHRTGILPRPTGGEAGPVFPRLRDGRVKGSPISQSNHSGSAPIAIDLRRQAEARLQKRSKIQQSPANAPQSAVAAQRLAHELQVHQVELELQNTELLSARDQLEILVEKYTDLYDFAPVGYFSLDEQGRILEVNLTGAAKLGVERARLIHRPLLPFVVPASRPIWLAFLNRVFAGTVKQVCDVALLRKDAGAFWASVHGISALSVGDPQKWCRVAFSDITALKQAEEVHHRVEVLAASNRKLEQEVIQRHSVEAALRQSEQHSRQLLEQTRRLAHRVLLAQEEERKQISRELHDEIAQTLTGINVELAALKLTTTASTAGIAKKISSTQRLVEKSVDIVHQFARELRPLVLDDLGLVPALHSFLKGFTKRTGLQIHFTTFSSARIQQLNNVTRTVLYRVAQEALTNVARHAHASRVDVRIQKLPRAIGLTIKDNGQSFPVARMLHAKTNKRLGLLGMRERVEMIGGSLRIESAPGQGTTIHAEVPFTTDRTRGGGGNKPSARFKF